MKLVTRGAVIRLAWLFGILLALMPVAWWFLLRMPGESYALPRGEGTPPDAALVEALRRDVAHLCGTIGQRNVGLPTRLAQAADWISGELRAAGYAPGRQVFRVRGVPCANVEAELAGDSGIVIVGAHYDGVPGCPAADDNGSGVAATLALARRLAASRPEHTLRFLFFVNEEPPYFRTDDMGSLRYARRCRERGENVVAMLSLETLGYFTSEPHTQRYPLRPLSLLYGDRGDFVGFVGDVASRALVREAVRTFREHARIPSQGIALFAAVPGVGWSDHWAFWQCDYPALMVTDTAPYRYPHYHQVTDTPDRLDYDGLALVVEGLDPVVRSLARAR